MLVRRDSHRPPSMFESYAMLSFVRLFLVFSLFFARFDWINQQQKHEQQYTGLSSFYFATAFSTSAGASLHVSGRGSISTSTSTSLFAIGALAKKAKLAALQEEIKQNGISPEVMHYVQLIKDAGVTSTTTPLVVGPVQLALSRQRRGTITVVAEYKRKLYNGKWIAPGTIYDDPLYVSPILRDYGASAVAINSDPRMGGCSYESDVKTFVEEQRRAQQKVPGPIPVINNDFVVDAYQIAKSAAYKCDAVVLQYETFSQDVAAFQELLDAARLCSLEVIVEVTNQQQVQQVVDLGCTMISVVNCYTNEERVQAIQNITVPTSSPPICYICNIVLPTATIETKAAITSADTTTPTSAGTSSVSGTSSEGSTSDLKEIEICWYVRDKGYHSVWVCDVLYKNTIGSVTASSTSEHPGAIIRSIKSKSSLKWASTKAYSGRGEGAKEYLGDILM